MNTKKVLIYQIGRLDFNAFEANRFCIHNEYIEASLTSFAIGDFFCRKGYGKDDIDTILLYPVSLPFNSGLFKNNNFLSHIEQNSPNFARFLKDAFNSPNRYLDNPSELFAEHPHSLISKNFLVIYSLGKYKGANEEIVFESHYSDIVLQIFTDMVLRYLEGEDYIESIIIDISSGHNIYVSALLEALRHFGIWVNLVKWGDNRPNLKVAFSDPIIFADREREYKIYFEDQSFKAFFTSPVSYLEDVSDYKLARRIFGADNLRKKKKQLQTILESFLLLFSAIKNNTPLVPFRFGYLPLSEIKDFLKGLIEFSKEQLSKSYQKSPGLKKDDYLKVFHVLGFRIALSRILGEEEVLSYYEKGVPIDKIDQKSREIYKLFSLTLNTQILGNEIKKLKEDIKSDCDWTLLLKLKYENTERANCQPNKRNFIAHAGFEANITECKRDADKIYLRYVEDDKYLTMIKNWLIRSIN